MKIKKIIHIFIICILITTLIFSLIKIIQWKNDNDNTKKVVKTIEQKVEITEVENNENIEIINQPTENINENDPYWDYIKMNLINVNFQELKKENKDTVGWIQVNGTNINYPFVQTSDNEYYLNHSFDKNINNAGWVFLDYRNNINTLDKNTIIYAHSRLNGTLFGTLKNILNTNWVNNTDNYVIKLSTETENTLWQVFSVYKIPTTTDYLQIYFNNNENFINFANMLKNRSNFNFNTTINEKDKILTLSTCYNDNEKTVLHAKLIKKETK